MIGRADGEPDQSKLDPDEVAWAGWWYADDLAAARDLGRLTFVDGFFEDIELALSEQG